MSGLPQIHRRHPVIGRIRAALSSAICEELRKDGSITYGDLMAALSEEMRTWAGYQVKDEREGPQSNVGPAGKGTPE